MRIVREWEVNSAEAGGTEVRARVRSPRVEKFEDLIAWQKAHQLALLVYRLTSNDPFVRDFGLKDQVRRAAISVMSNIAERFDRYNRVEFRHFLNIARGSVAEVRSQCYLAHSLRYVSEQEFTESSILCREASNLVGALRKSLEGGAS